MKNISAKRLLLHGAYWIIYILSYPLFYSAITIGNLDYYPKQIVSMAMGCIYIIPAAYFITYYLIPRFLIIKKRFLFFIIGYLSTFIVLTIVDTLFVRFYVVPKNHPELTDSFFLIALKAKYISRVFFILHSEIFIFVAFRFFIQYIKNYFEKETLKNKMAETELKMLKGQIHPHFLFNTLNNIYTMSLDCDNEDLSESIARMSDILRFTIYECNTSLVPVEKELTIITDYIYLEKLRYSDIKIEISTPKNLQNINIVPLILFTFVENAFKHGTSKTIKGKWITIDLFLENKFLHFSIKNSKKNTNNKLENFYHYSKGIGINNAIKRLDLFYGKENYSLDIQDHNVFFEINLRINLSYTNDKIRL